MDIKMETVEKIRKFVSRYVRINELKDDENIFKAGAVNSLFAMQLIIFLETEFRIQVDNDDLDMSNFKSINSIVNFVQAKSAS